MMAGTVGEGDQRKHDGDLDQDADHRGQRRARIDPEQTDRDGDREFKEVRRPINAQGAVTANGTRQRQAQR